MVYMTVCCFLSLKHVLEFITAVDQGSAPSSPPTSPRPHFNVPLSPLVRFQQKADRLSPSPTHESLRFPSPLPRRRYVEEDHLQDKLGLELSPYDTASMYSMPSVLSLHSQVGGVVSRHEDQEVAKVMAAVAVSLYEWVWFCSLTGACLYAASRGERSRYHILCYILQIFQSWSQCFDAGCYTCSLCTGRGGALATRVT